MNSTLQDQLFGIFLHGLLDALLRYGLPALALCALLSWISARLTRKRRRRPLPRHAPPPRHAPAPRHAPPPLDTVPVTPRRPLTAYQIRRDIEALLAKLTAVAPPPAGALDPDRFNAAV